MSCWSGPRGLSGSIRPIIKLSNFECWVYSIWGSSLEEGYLESDFTLININYRKYIDVKRLEMILFNYELCFYIHSETRKNK